MAEWGPADGAVATSLHRYSDEENLPSCKTASTCGTNQAVDRSLTVTADLTCTDCPAGFIRRETAHRLPSCVEPLATTIASQEEKVKAALLLSDTVNMSSCGTVCTRESVRSREINVKVAYQQFASAREDYEAAKQALLEKDTVTSESR